VKFGSRDEMKTTDNKIIRQFLAGRAKGPIGMDEMAQDDDTGVQQELEDQEQERIDSGEIDEIMTV
jgi:hypothetical protein